MLDDILAWPNLCNAWERVADNQGAPGPDRLTINRFALHWEENLRTLRDLVRRGVYRPGRLRRVAIPKNKGGQRLLHIPNVGDRVLQRAALNVLDDVFEPRFLDCSFGYRPQRGIHQAVGEIIRLRDRDLRWVFDADIDDCFDSFDHVLLRRFLADVIRDKRVLCLLDLWIDCMPHRSKRLNRRAHGSAQRSGRESGRGIAQGMPISPLLCNVYLHQFDWRLVRRRWPLVRYADDFIVCCDSREQALEAQRVVDRALAALKLQIEPTKTHITSFDEGFDFLGVTFDNSGYSFTWATMRICVEGPTPVWLWDHIPDGY